LVPFEEPAAVATDRKHQDGQQQRLALQDKKLLEEYKAEINDLKALKMPSQDTKEEQANRVNRKRN